MLERCNAIIHKRKSINENIFQSNNFFCYTYLQPARHTKLEKADILEMTVKYLQTMQRSQLNMAVQADPNVLHKFKAGFSDCTDEVNRYISQMDGVDSGVKQRLIGHLNNCVTGIQLSAPYNTFNGNSNHNNSNFRNAANNAMSFSSSMPAHQSSLLPLAQDVNNNGTRIQMGGVQLIPSRLPTGELALVMPNSSNLSYFPASAFPINGNAGTRHSLDLLACTSLPRASAFNSVGKTNGKHISTDTSPPLSPASSMSSGDDSLTNAEYQPLTTTPPLQLQANFLNAFPTPPSGGSISMIPSNSMSRVSSTVSSVTLQQPQVTSTTEPLVPAPPTSNNVSIKMKPLSVITNTTGNSQPNVRPDVQYVNKKRPYPVDLSDDDNKSVKSELIDKVFKSEEPAQNQNDGESNGDMWRPW